MLDPSIPSDLKDLISQELEPDEKVQWSAMPKPRIFAGPSAGAFLFAIPWTAFSVFWIAGAAQFKMPQFNQGVDFFPLFGVPFFLIGIGMLSSPLWAYRNQRKTAYVITDRRAITIDGGRSSSTIRSYLPKDLNDIYRVQHKDGTGDVIITRVAWKDAEGDKTMKELGFLSILNAKAVEALLKQLAQPSE